MKGVTAAALLLASGAARPEDSGRDDAKPEIGQPVVEIAATPGTRLGRLRLQALVTSERIRRVDFLLDERLVATDRRFPFGATVAAPSDGGGRLEALALDREGRVLARDVTVLDVVRDPLRVTLREVRPLEATGWLEVGAEVSHSPGIVIERVDFYRDDRYVASVATWPYRTRIPAAPESAFLRAVALTRGGRIAEGVRLLGDPARGSAVSVSLVELYAMVSRRSGEPVSGLEADSFELRQGDVALPIERFSEGDDVPLSVALLIDTSGSMLDSMEQAERSARRFLESTLDEGDRALLIDFDSRPHLRQESTDDLEALLEQFPELRSRGGSAIYDAILFGTLRLERATGRRALVVMTDGLDSGSRVSAGDCASLARRSGVPIFVLDMGEAAPGVPSHESMALGRLAETTGGGLYTIRDAGDVVEAYRAIELQLRGQYLLGFSAPRSLSGDELDALSVHTSDGSLRVRTILGGQVRITD